MAEVFLLKNCKLATWIVASLLLTLGLAVAICPGRGTSKRPSAVEAAGSPNWRCEGRWPRRIPLPKASALRERVLRSECRGELTWPISSVISFIPSHL